MNKNLTRDAIQILLYFKAAQASSNGSYGGSQYSSGNQHSGGSQYSGNTTRGQQGNPSEANSQYTQSNNRIFGIILLI